MVDTALPRISSAAAGNARPSLPWASRCQLYLFFQPSRSFFETVKGFKERILLVTGQAFHQKVLPLSHQWAELLEQSAAVISFRQRPLV